MKNTTMDKYDLARWNSKWDLPEDPVKDCILWKGILNNCGYSLFRLNGSNWSAHRLALAIYTSENPVGLDACHKCKNRHCINPHHLEWGTRAKNNGADKIRDGTDNRGARNGKAKLTAEQVMEIRNSNEPVCTISKKFNITSGYVYRLRQNKTWKHLDNNIDQ